MGDFSRNPHTQKNIFAQVKKNMPSGASDISHFHEKYAGTKQYSGFQRGLWTGNYVFRSKEGGSGGNGDEWQA